MSEQDTSYIPHGDTQVGHRIEGMSDASEPVIPIEREPIDIAQKQRVAIVSLMESHAKQALSPEDKIRQIFAHEDADGTIEESDAAMYTRLIWSGEERIHVREVAAVAHVETREVKEHMQSAGVPVPTSAKERRLDLDRTASVAPVDPVREVFAREKERDDVMYRRLLRGREPLHIDEIASASGLYPARIRESIVDAGVRLPTGSDARRLTYRRQREMKALQLRLARQRIDSKE